MPGEALPRASTHGVRSHGAELTAQSASSYARTSRTILPYLTARNYSDAGHRYPRLTGALLGLAGGARSEAASRGAAVPPALRIHSIAGSADSCRRGSDSPSLPVKYQDGESIFFSHAHLFRVTRYAAWQGRAARGNMMQPSKRQRARAAPAVVPHRGRLRCLTPARELLREWQLEPGARPEAWARATSSTSPDHGSRSLRTRHLPLSGLTSRPSPRRALAEDNRCGTVRDATSCCTIRMTTSRRACALFDERLTIPTPTIKVALYRAGERSPIVDASDAPRTPKGRYRIVERRRASTSSATCAG